jgi:hypothetical protein
MLHMMLPFEQHYDSGFGSVADSFRYAADALDEGNHASLNPHLPVSFLYRHAIELYLKSGIITLHRRFSIPYGETPSSGEPSIPIDQKRKFLYNVHAVEPLFAYLCTLIDQQMSELSTIPQTDWLLPPELGQWIKAIEATDSSSTFFRYPVTKDASRDKEKSTIQREGFDEILERMHGDGPKVTAMLMLNSKGQVVDSFSHDDRKSKDTVVILKQAAEMLHDLRAMMSYTLANTM